MASGRPVVKPSEVHTYVYCPRLYFFERHLGRERGLLERLRLMAGTLFHLLKSIPSRLSGARVETPLEAELGGIRVVGRADEVRLEDGVLTIIERKSGRAPRSGAWASDVLQAAVYAILALRAEGAREALLRLEYRDSSREIPLSDDIVSAAVKALDEVVLVKYYGVVPYARRGPRRCSRCPFRVECEALDRDVDVEGDLYEPGAWLAGLSLIPPSGGYAGGGRGRGHEGWRPDIREGR